MSQSLSHPIPTPRNEPVLGYAPGSAERVELQQALAAALATEAEVPVVVGDRELRTGTRPRAGDPHDHQHTLATWHQAGPDEVQAAAAAAAEAWQDWSRLPFDARAAVFLKAAELLAGPWRQRANAACMLNQSKTAHQAEIDSACELIDFWRYNPHYAARIFQDQPSSGPGWWDYVEYRALEGFIFAVTPFNFASIAGNLPTAPALMGNTVLWKPASSAVYTAHVLLQVLQEAGLPPGVINLIPGRGSQVGNPVLAEPGLAGIHFTGSTEVFQGMWKTVGENIATYRGYPRIVGETGGKDFIFVHESADIPALVCAAVRGAYEYQGQKCSAASRMYVPRSIWGEVKDRLVGQIGEIAMGDVRDFTNFMGAVIDEAAYDTIVEYIEHARTASDATILTGGGSSKETGYFIEPTLVETTNPHFRLMEEEIFGPVLTVYPYDETDLDGALALCNTTSPYALTGAIFGTDRHALTRMNRALEHAAGNFYLNDKPTGAVVGHQPFGGGRASGTNDKAGSALNLLRWTSVRTIKETFVPPTDFRYPYMGA